MKRKVTIMPFFGMEELPNPLDDYNNGEDLNSLLLKTVDLNSVKLLSKDFKEKKEAYDLIRDKIFCKEKLNDTLEVCSEVFSFANEMKNEAKLSLKSKLKMKR